MSDDQKTYLVAGVAAAVSLVAWVWLIAVPAWTSYWRVRDRILSVIMSVYVLAGFVFVGGGVAAVVLWYADRL
jgi:hypothetical protein